MPCFARSRHHHRISGTGNRGDHIDLVERVRHQNGGLAAILCLGTGGHDGVIQPFAGAVQRHHLRVRIHIHTVAPLDPSGNRAAQLRRAVVGRVAVKSGSIFSDHIGDPCRKSMFRLANRHVDRRATAFMRIKQCAQARPRVGRKVRKPLGVHHFTASGSGSFTPRLFQSTQGLAPRPDIAGRRARFVSFRPIPLRRLRQCAAGALLQRAGPSA